MKQITVRNLTKSFLIFFVLGVINQVQSKYIEAIELISIPISGLNLLEDCPELGQTQGKYHQYSLYKKLQSKQIKISNPTIIGTISQISLSQDPNLKLYFTYTLIPQKNQPQKLQIHLKLNIQTDSSRVLSSQFRVKLDFIICYLPQDVQVRVINMTKPSTSVLKHLQNSTQYEIFFFLNGFTKISLSGNLNHHYNSEGMFQIEYNAHNQRIIWEQNHDYVLLTGVIMKRKYSIEKFFLQSSIFYSEYPPNMDFFFGIKGLTDEKFAGKFYTNESGVTFQVSSLMENYSYGITLIAFNTQNFDVQNDWRQHQDNGKKEQKVKLIIICFIIVGILLFFGMILRITVHAIKKFRNSDEDRLPLTETSRKQKKYYNTKTEMEEESVQNRIQTIKEVEEEYEESLRSTLKNQKTVKSFMIAGETEENFDSTKRIKEQNVCQNI